MSCHSLQAKAAKAAAAKKAAAEKAYAKYLAAQKAAEKAAAAKYIAQGEGRAAGRRHRARHLPDARQRAHPVRRRRNPGPGTSRGLSSGLGSGCKDCYQHTLSTPMTFSCRVARRCVCIDH